MINTQKKKIFIIGATGYIGNSLYYKMQKTFRVYGTTSQNHKSFIHFQLKTPNKFDYKQIESGDIIIFTAAISSPDLCAKEFQKAWDVNVLGTSEFISRVLEKKAYVIFFSSDTVYGERANDFNENVKVSPKGEYAKMKYEVEKTFLGNPYFKSIRLSYVFSIDDTFTKYLLSCFKNQKVAQVFDSFYRSIIYKQDVIDAIEALVKNWNKFPQKIINFAGPNVISRIEFVEMIQEVLLSKLNFEIIPPPKDFFKSRPKIIAMKSLFLESILDRPLYTILKAIHVEAKQGG